MRTNSQKDDLLAPGKSEEHPVTPIDTKTPYLLAFRLKLFGVKGSMKWILSEKPLLLFGFFLKAEGQQFVASYKLVRQDNLQNITSVLVL